MYDKNHMNFGWIRTLRYEFERERQPEIQACCLLVRCHCIRQRGERPDWHPWRCKLRDSVIEFTRRPTSCRCTQQKATWSATSFNLLLHGHLEKGREKPLRSLVSVHSKQIGNTVQSINVTESFTVVLFALGIIEFRANCNKYFKLDLMGEQAFVNQQRLSGVLTFIRVEAEGQVQVLLSEADGLRICCTVRQQSLSNAQMLLSVSNEFSIRVICIKYNIWAKV